MGGHAAEDSFGPAVIFVALMEAGVRFHFIGFITHYASQLHDQHPVRAVDHPRSHAENRDRLARVLRELGAATDNGIPEPFTGDGSALTAGNHRFQTRHGDVAVYVHTDVQDVPGLDEFSDGIQINITVPLPRLRAYVATGKFPGLDDVLEILELFESSRDSDRPSENQEP